MSESTVAHSSSKVTVYVRGYEDGPNEDETSLFINALGRLAQYLDPGQIIVDDSGERMPNDHYVELPFKEIRHVDSEAEVTVYTHLRVSATKSRHGDLNYVCTFTDDDCCAFGWIKRPYHDIVGCYSSNTESGLFQFTLDVDALKERFPKISFGDFWSAFEYFFGSCLKVVYGGTRRRRPPSQVATVMVADLLTELSEGAV